MSYHKQWGKGWMIMHNSPHANSTRGWYIYFGLCSHDTRIKFQVAARRHDWVFTIPRGDRFLRMMGRK